MVIFLPPFSPRHHSHIPHFCRRTCDVRDVGLINVQIYKYDNYITLQWLFVVINLYKTHRPIQVDRRSFYARQLKIIRGWSWVCHSRLIWQQELLVQCCFIGYDYWPTLRWHFVPAVQSVTTASHMTDRLATSVIATDTAVL